MMLFQEVFQEILEEVFLEVFHEVFFSCESRPRMAEHTKSKATQGFFCK